MNERWNCGISLEAGYWSIVAQSGEIIVLRVARRKYAEQIRDEHNRSLKPARLDTRQRMSESAKAGWKIRRQKQKGSAT